MKFHLLFIILSKISFLEKKKAKKRALSTPNDNFKDNFQRLLYQRIFGSKKTLRRHSVPPCHALQALFLLVVGMINNGYAIRGLARASPKFFFCYVTEKLRIYITLYSIPPPPLNANVFRLFYKILKSYYDYDDENKRNSSILNNH